MITLVPGCSPWRLRLRPEPATSAAALTRSRGDLVLYQVAESVDLRSLVVDFRLLQIDPVFRERDQVTVRNLRHRHFPSFALH